uniref:RNA-dependent RNA polymerase n=1 Tax=Mongoose picobirna-like virus Mongoose/KNA/M17A/2017 TaxID=2700030 RepID=A0A6B9UQ12_9VIRU|nr:RNA-dependent RNA polymerase [Mongoose picobirna-like virus Mongoose/KNA/M17A/2017]
MIKKLNLKDYFILPNQGLQSYLHKTEVGSDLDIRTPFWDEKPRSSIMAMWQAVVDSSNLEAKLPGLYKFEMDMKSKVGPLSVQEPLLRRIPDVMDYYNDPKGQEVSPRAIACVKEEFKALRGLRLRDADATVAEMRRNTNSGAPYFTRRSRVESESLELAKTRSLAYPAVLGWRGQEGGIDTDNVKQRVVWMFPFQTNIAELQFYQPMIRAIQAHKLIPAYLDHTAVDARITNLFDTKPTGDLVVETDFTKFDQSFWTPLQHVARAVYADWGPQLDKWIREVFPVKYNIPMVLSNNLISTGPHGMASGSGGTNADESIAHRALQHEAALASGQTLHPSSMAYGDDGILTFKGITVDKVVAQYTKHGVTMNESKQGASTTECVFLRRWHSMSYRKNGIMVGVYSTFRALGRLMGQERYYDPKQWGPEMVIMRALSILENCNQHPLFEEFIEFVIKGDKYGLGTKLPGFLDNLQAMYAKARDVMPDYGGFVNDNMKRKGILSWKVVQYLINR